MKGPAPLCEEEELAATIPKWNIIEAIYEPNGGKQFPGLIININKPKIYYQLTAEFAKPSVHFVPNEHHHCCRLFLLVSAISFRLVSRLSFAHFPLYRLRCQQIPLINSNSLRCSGSTSFLSFNTQFGVVPSHLFLATLPFSFAPFQGVKLFAFLFCD